MNAFEETGGYLEPVYNPKTDARRMILEYDEDLGCWEVEFANGQQGFVIEDPAVRRTDEEIQAGFCGPDYTEIPMVNLINLVKEQYE